MALVKLAGLLFQCKAVFFKGLLDDLECRRTHAVQPGHFGSSCTCQGAQAGIPAVFKARTAGAAILGRVSSDVIMSRL